MYIELFILDNFAFAYIILHTAKIISRLRLRAYYAAICILMAFLSALAMNNSWLLGIFPKMGMLFIMACCFKFVNLKTFISAAFSVFISTVVYGGIAYAFINSRFFYGALYAPITLRWINYILVICFFLYPSIIKLFNAAKLNDAYQLIIETNLAKVSLSARLDTGNDLMARGLPVIIIDEGCAGGIFEEGFIEGMLYVPFATVAGSGVLKAQRAEVSYYDGEKWSEKKGCFIAKSKLNGCQALIGQKIICESGVTL